MPRFKKKKNKSPNREEEYRRDLDILGVALKKHEIEIERPVKIYRQYLKGIQWSVESKGRYNDETVDNMVYTAISAIAPSINLNRPKITIKPRQSKIRINGEETDAFTAAIRQQLLIQLLFDELEIKETLDKVLVDALLGPRGITMTGFEVKTRREEAKDEKDGLSTPTDFMDIIDEETLFVDRVSPLDLIVDPESQDPDLKDAKMVFHRWTMTKEEVKRKYNQDVNINVELNREDGGSKFNKYSHSTDASGTADIWGRVEGFDMWSREEGVVKTLVEGHDKYLDHKPWPLEYDRYPFNILWFNYSPDSSTPIADTQLYKSKQDFLNQLESKISDHVSRLSDRKYAYNSNKVKQSTAEKWARDKSGAILPGKGDPNTFVAAVSDGGVSQDLYIGVRQTKGDILAQLGISQFEAGGSGDFGSLGEAEIANQGTGVRRADRGTKFERFISKVLRNLANVARQTLPDDTEIPVDSGQFRVLQEQNPDLLVKNDKGEVYPFTKLDKDSLSGKFIFKVEVVPAGPNHDIARKQEAMTLLQLAENNPFLEKFEVTRIALELLGFQYITDRILRDPKVVAQEQKQAQRSQIEAAIEVDAPKRTTDIAKTKMKSATTLITTGMQLEAKDKISKREDAGEKVEGARKAQSTMLSDLLAAAKTSNGSKE